MLLHSWHQNYWYNTFISPLTISDIAYLTILWQALSAIKLYVDDDDNDDDDNDDDNDVKNKSEHENRHKSEYEYESGQENPQDEEDRAVQNR